MAGFRRAVNFKKLHDSKGEADEQAKHGKCQALQVDSPQLTVDNPFDST